MTVVLIAVIAILVAAVLALAAGWVRDRVHRPAPVRATSARRILFPFVAGARAGTQPAPRTSPGDRRGAVRPDRDRGLGP